MKPLKKDTMIAKSNVSKGMKNHIVTNCWLL